MKKKILVFPCGSEIGLEIFHSLRYSKEIELFGGSSVDDHGKFAYKNYIGNLPFVEDQEFIECINQIATINNIDYIFPAHDSVVLKLALAVHEKQLNCGLITSPYKTCLLCRSKKDTLELFSRKIRTPNLYNNLNDIKDWPVFLKPTIGQGSKGTAIAQNSIECEYLIKKDSTLLILEYLPGEEYTVDCFTDKNGKLVFIGGRERARIQNGISVNTKPVKNKQFYEIAEIINKTLEFQGMWFFQLKRSKTNELALMEIAPRIAGSMGLYRNLGVNFALMSVYDAEGFPVEALTNDYYIEMDRALESKYRLEIEFDHVYLDFDDCLIINNSLNTDLVKFLFQCKQKNIKLHLLTRHEQTLTKTLADLCLLDLFDSQNLVNQNELKSKYIKFPKSIFIDDSYRERKDVKESLGIPIFAPDALESLLGLVE